MSEWDRIYDRIYNNGRSRSTVFENRKTGVKRTVNKNDQSAILKSTKARFDSVDPKSDGMFNERIRDGWRTIASIPKLALITNPEIVEDDQAMLEFIDKHPQYKTLPASYTKFGSSRGRRGSRGGAREILLKASNK